MSVHFLGFSLIAWTVANLVASAYMTGVIWFVQFVHYPLFANVSSESFATYEQLHATRTGWVVAPPMLFELAASAALAYATFGSPSALLGTMTCALVLVAWLSTFAIQVPCHNRLQKGFDAATHQRLVHTNWLRTVAWTLRTALLVLLLRALLR